MIHTTVISEDYTVIKITMIMRVRIIYTIISAAHIAMWYKSNSHSRELGLALN